MERLIIVRGDFGAGWTRAKAPRANHKRAALEAQHKAYYLRTVLHSLVSAIDSQDEEARELALSEARELVYTSDHEATGWRSELATMGKAVSA